MNQITNIACTALSYRDADGANYLGRTLELTTDLPYQLLYLPKGREFVSQPGENPPLRFTSGFSFLAVVMPDRVPSPEAPISPADLKVVEGVNEAGLTFSLLAYPSVGKPGPIVNEQESLLAATDLGSWTLGQFQSVAEVRAALTNQRVVLDAIGLLGGVHAPFHYVLHDRGGDSIVLEFHEGVFHVYDNPVGVLTNGPEFPWHLTNLANYTDLTNVDRSTATMGKLRVQQPDSGIATANLPASNTSVGRFVRAVHYSRFAEKAANPDDAIRTLAHIMNNFDRPKGITTSPPGETGHLEVDGLGGQPAAIASEFTSWSNLTDLNRSRFFVRTYHALNYTMFDLAELAKTDRVMILPLSALDGMATDGTKALLAD